VLDGPPVLGLADALVLSAVSDGSLMVVNEATNRRILSHARDQLAKVQTRAAGAVLNNFGPAFSYYYSDYYAYSTAYYQTEEPPEEAEKLSRRERKRRAKEAAGQAAAMTLADPPSGNGFGNGEVAETTRDRAGEPAGRGDGIFG
jgi:Mrp family chromosome partitioning ATPase